MRKNTDLHLKTRTVTVNKRFWELPQVLREVQKKLFCEDTGIHVFSEVFGLLWSLLGSTDELFSFVMVIYQISPEL
jgi:hypothetical protein